MMERASAPMMESARLPRPELREVRAIPSLLPRSSDDLLGRDGIFLALEPGDVRPLHRASSGMVRRQGRLARSNSGPRLDDADLPAGFVEHRAMDRRVTEPSNGPRLSVLEPQLRHDHPTTAKRPVRSTTSAPLPRSSLYFPTTPVGMKDWRRSKSLPSNVTRLGRPL